MNHFPKTAARQRGPLLMWALFFTIYGQGRIAKEEHSRTFASFCSKQQVQQPNTQTHSIACLLSLGHVLFPIVRPLRDWLRANHPNDVLIPCAHGDKRPLFRYQGDQGDGWTWDKLDAFLGNLENDRGREADWAVLLGDLCVVDVDSKATAALLEERFPILLNVPCEATKRGFHYFFRRSTLCDSAGYFDGCAQVLESVDFKSVTPTGTKGVIVVTPSVDKAWIRAPWSTAVVEIPDELLTSVARPSPPNAAPPLRDSKRARTEGTNLTERCSKQVEEQDDKAGLGAKKQEVKEEALMISFEDEADGTLRVVGAHLSLVRSMDYCASLLSGRWSSVDATVEPVAGAVQLLRIPCSRAVFEELCCLMLHGTLSQSRVPHAMLLASIDGMIDMLGCPRREKSLVLERGTFLADLYQMKPLWWCTQRQEEALMLGTSAEESDAQLIVISAELSRYVGYSPLTKDSMWLFESLPPLLNETCKDSKVLQDDPPGQTLAQLPPVVVEILRRHSSCVAVAGGAVLGSVSRFIEHGNDVDLFVYGLNQDASAIVLRQIEEYVMSTESYTMSVSPAAVTYEKRERSWPSRQSPVAAPDFSSVPSRSSSVYTVHGPRFSNILTCHLAVHLLASTLLRQTPLLLRPCPPSWRLSRPIPSGWTSTTGRLRACRAS